MRYLRKSFALFVVMCGVSSGYAQQPNNAPSVQKLGLKDQQFTVRLLSPISTLTGHEGDVFSATVISPDQFQGGIMTGRITKIRKPKAGVGNGKAEIQFSFNSLSYGGRTASVAAVLGDVSNSRGVKDVDEEGRVIGKTSNKKRVGSVIAGALAGALVGGLSSGGSGAAIGAAAGAGAGLIIGLTMTTTGSDIRFEPGSVFTLKVSDSR